MFQIARRRKPLVRKVQGFSLPNIYYVPCLDVLTTVPRVRTRGRGCVCVCVCVCLYLCAPGVPIGTHQCCVWWSALVRLLLSLDHTLTAPVVAVSLLCASTHRPLSSCFWGLPYRILNINHKRELLRGLWVTDHTCLSYLCRFVALGCRGIEFFVVARSRIWSFVPRNLSDQLRRFTCYSLLL